MSVHLCVEARRGHQVSSGRSPILLVAGSLPEGGTPTFSSRQEARKPHLPTSAYLLQVSFFCECWDSNFHPQGYKANTGFLLFFFWGQAFCSFWF